MLITNDDDLFEKPWLLRPHAMTSLTLNWREGHAWSYDVVELDHNYRIDELRSAIGLAQLAKLDRNNEGRRHLAGLCRERLGELPGIAVPFADDPGISSAHIRAVLLPRDWNRPHLMEQMKSQGIETSIHYPPVHTFSAYRGIDPLASNRLAVNQDVAVRQVTLPLYPTMNDGDVVAVAEAARNSLLA